MLLDAQNGRKRKPEVIAKAAVMIIIYQETVYTDISLGKLFFVIVFMLGGQISNIRVRNYMYYPSCRSGNKYRYKRKIDAYY